MKSTILYLQTYEKKIYSLKSKKSLLFDEKANRLSSLRVRKITSLPYKWKVRFDIESPLSPSSKFEWKKEDIKIAVKDDATKGEMAIENYSSDDTIAKEEAMKKIQGLFDSHYILKKQRLEITEVEAELLNKDEIKKIGRPITEAKTYSVSLFLKGVETLDLDNSLDFSKKIESHKEKGRIERIMRWLRRGLDDTDKIDRFISCWISFNAFYNHYQGASERVRFKDLLENLMDEKTSEEIINSNTSQINMLKMTNIKYKDSMLNQELENCLKSKQYKDALKYSVECIYQVRCDLFHGEETLIQQNTRLVNSCIPLLVEVIRKCLYNFIHRS